MKNWQVKLIDLIEKEFEQCCIPSGNAECNCYMLKIIDFVEKLLKEKQNG